MSKYPVTLYSDLLDISSDTLSERGKEALENLHQKGFGVKEGLTTEIVNQLQSIVVEKSIIEYCPKDRSERFASRAMAEEWMHKGRAFYVLIDLESPKDIHTIAGYGWIGEKHSDKVPDGETTFSLRISERYQGKGLAAPFSVLMLAAAHKQYDAKKLWLETWASNQGAVHIYHKIGFKDVAEKKDIRPSLVVQRVDDVRIYMNIEDSI